MHGTGALVFNWAFFAAVIQIPSPNGRIRLMIPASYIEALLASVDLVELISKTVALRKTGSNFSGICPFHKADKGSFTVAPAKGFYHCFSCGAHGNAIGFLMESNGMSFPEAVEFLSEVLGWPLPENSPARLNEKIKHAVISDSLDVALRYYKQSLKESPEAIAFLKDRGISGKTAAKFWLGFAPNGWQNLEAVFGGDYGSNNVLNSGLVVKNDHGRVYDRYRNRLMLPFFDYKGRTVGFIGRAISSAEPTFLLPAKDDSVKSRLDIFGLNQARAAIRTLGSAIVAQGCMDVVALHEQGFCNVISIARTRAVSSEHISAIFRHTSLILFCFDATAAGNRKAWRAMEAALPVITDKKSIRFVMLREGQSPSSAVALGEGRSDFGLWIKSAIPLSEFLLQTLTERHDAMSVEGRAALMGEATSILDKIQAPFVKQFIQKRLDALCRDDLELLGSTEEHDAFLVQSLSTAICDLVIVSPWISRQGIERFDLCRKIAEARQRGVSITIYTDLELNQDRAINSPYGDLIADGSLAALTAAGARVEFVRRIHSKMLIVDTTLMCIGSFNWLSAARAGKYRRHEVSIVYRHGGIANQKAEILEKLEARKASYTGVTIETTT